MWVIFNWCINYIFIISFFNHDPPTFNPWSKSKPDNLFWFDDQSDEKNIYIIPKKLLVSSYLYIKHTIKSKFSYIFFLYKSYLILKIPWFTTKTFHLINNEIQKKSEAFMKLQLSLRFYHNGRKIMYEGWKSSIKFSFSIYWPMKFVVGKESWHMGGLPWKLWNSNFLYRQQVAFSL